MSFRMVKIFLTPGDLGTSEDQSQTLNTFKSNVSTTVRDREKVSIEVR